MTHDEHTFSAHVIWTGDRGSGTSDYASYGRDHRVVVTGKPDIAGSASPHFRGEPDRHNPEELFLAAIAACQMLFHLSLCARSGVRVMAYEGTAQGTLELVRDGGGRFASVHVVEYVTIAPDSDADLAARMGDVAHERCFIANSCSVPITRELRVSVAGVAGAA